MITYKLEMINLYGSDLIGRIDVSWNYSTRTDARKFYVKDHLGSIRQTLNESGAVTMAMDYYAFGATKNSYVVGGSVDKYKFTSKERDSETGLDYFGARYYDSKIGRWMSVDPLAEKYPGLSPYNYCANNPLLLIDPTGKSYGDYWKEDGTFLGSDGKKDGKNYLVPESNEETVTSAIGDNEIKTAQQSSILLPDSKEIGLIQQQGEKTLGSKFQEFGGGVFSNGKMIARSGDPVTDIGAPHASIDLSFSKNEGNLKSTFHFHPLDGKWSPTQTMKFGQEPSRKDRENAGNRTDIVLSIQNSKAYFYNSQGTRATFPLNKLYNLGK